MSEMLSSVLPGLCSGLRLTEGIMLPCPPEARAVFFQEGTG